MAPICLSLITRGEKWGLPVLRTISICSRGHIKCLLFHACCFHLSSIFFSSLFISFSVLLFCHYVFSLSSCSSVPLNSLRITLPLFFIHCCAPGLSLLAALLFASPSAGRMGMCCMPACIGTERNNGPHRRYN